MRDLGERNADTCGFSANRTVFLDGLEGALSWCEKDGFLEIPGIAMKLQSR
jgi:hypothetical protein